MSTRCELSRSPRLQGTECEKETSTRPGAPSKWRGSICGWSPAWPLGTGPDRTPTSLAGVPGAPATVRHSGLLHSARRPRPTGATERGPWPRRADLRAFPTVARAPHLPAPSPPPAAPPPDPSLLPALPTPKSPSPPPAAPGPSSLPRPRPPPLAPACPCPRPLMVRARAPPPQPPAQPPRVLARPSLPQVPAHRPSTLPRHPRSQPAVREVSARWGSATPRRGRGGAGTGGKDSAAAPGEAVGRPRGRTGERELKLAGPAEPPAPGTKWGRPAECARPRRAGPGRGRAGAGPGAGRGGGSRAAQAWLAPAGQGRERRDGVPRARGSSSRARGGGKAG